MIKFLETEGVTAQIFQMIRNAKKELIIASPYLKIRPKLKSYFEEAIDRQVPITFVHGKGKLDLEDEEWFERIGNRVKHYTNPHSHAKCYLNEQEAIVTSLNLYQYSQDNNYEMGILIPRSVAIYKEVRDSVLTIIKHSEEWKEQAQQQMVSVQLSGHCIRCNTEIPLDPSRPYCRSCFSSWNFFQNENFKEKQCHSCGQPTASSMRHPLCNDCFKDHSPKPQYAGGW